MRLIFVSFTIPLVVCFAFAQQASLADRLAESRQQIDEIDRQIVELINKRATVVEKIGKIKSAAGVPVAAPNREKQVLDHVAEMGSAGPLPVTRLKAIYSTLLVQMRDWEEEQHNASK